MRISDRVTDGMRHLTSAGAKPAQIVRDLRKILGTSLEAAFHSRAGRTYQFTETADTTLRRLRFDACISGRDVGVDGVRVGMVVDSINEGSRLKARMGCSCSQRRCGHAKSALVELALAGRPEVEAMLREELARERAKLHASECGRSASDEGKTEGNRGVTEIEPTTLPEQKRMSNGAFAILEVLGQRKPGRSESRAHVEPEEEDQRATVRFVMMRSRLGLQPKGGQDSEDKLVLTAFVRRAKPHEELWQIYRGTQLHPQAAKFVQAESFLALLRRNGKSFGWEADRAQQSAVDVCLSMIRLGYDVGAREVPICSTEAFDLLELLCKSDLLMLGEQPGAVVKVGEALEVLGDWEQQEAGRWALVTNVLPSLRLIGSERGIWYLDEGAAKIGRLEVGASQVLVEMGRKGLWITDGDFKTLPERLRAEGLENVLPPLPRIEVFKGEKLRARLKIQLSDEGVGDRGPMFGYAGVAPKGKVLGTKATLQIDRPSKTGGVSQSDGSIVVYDGSRRTVHEVDEEEARESLERVKRSFPKLAWEGDSVVISRSERAEIRSREAFEFQRKVLPRLKAHDLDVGFGVNFEWRLHQQEDWDIQIVEDDTRWYSATVTTSVGGRRVDMTKVVRAIVADPKFSAWLDDEGQTRWTYQVSRGNFVDIPKDRIRRLLGGLMDLNGSPVGDSGRLKLSRFDINAITTLSSVEGVVLRGGEDLVRQAKVLATLDDSPDPALAAVMKLPPRHYQWVGLNWMRARYGEGFGCILGDEMAAGKTVQTLMHIHSSAAALGAGRKPSLVVATKTILETRTWEVEIEKFFGNMTSIQYAGTQRSQLLSRLKEFDVVLVTYQTLAIDLHLLNKIDWNIIAADEGHKMCNGRTDAARAFEAIRGRQKVILTGTAMQNRPDDLYSLVNLTVPGLLYDRPWFRERFVHGLGLGGATALSKEATRKMRLLGAYTSPFYLMRTNAEVKNELPQVNLVERHVTMGEVQQDIYEGVRASMDREVQDLVAETGLAKSQVAVLARINRLRQVCCHPALLRGHGASDRCPSTKADEVADILDEMVAERKKVVITSEWVSMLELLEPVLRQKGIRYTMLTGKTNNRLQALESFRSGGVDFMLMSLKVGGEALNIPEADFCVIFEPWWNPKVIDQAIARFTRDNRDKQITAMHLLCHGTLEHGVMAIARKKGVLIDAIRDGNATATASGITQEDLVELFRPMPKA